MACCSGARGARFRRHGTRQVDLHRRAGAGFAGKPHRAAELRRHAVDLRKPEATALADRLGGEERLERVLHDIAGHADTGIDHRDPHVVARIECVQPSGFVSIHISRCDAQLTAIGHRVSGVDGEVENDKLELRGITRRRPEVGRQIGLDLHESAEAALQQFTHAGDDGIHIHRSRRQILTACIGQQLLGELPAAQRGPQRGLDQGTPSAGRSGGSAAVQGSRSPR